MLIAIIFAAIAYLIGSLSSAIIVCRLLKLPDPRAQGSMNPGATNVLRIGGKIPALITLSGDLLKGFIPVLIAHLIGKINGIELGLVAIAALLGHIFPLFFKFQGGKGVATMLGGLLALQPIVGIAVIIVWIIVAIVFHYSSLAAIVAAIFAPIFTLILGNTGYFLPTLVITLILLYRHLDNIKRLQAGTEGKISF